MNSAMKQQPSRTSEYRGPTLDITYEKNLPGTSQNVPEKSYAHATKYEINPTKDQAIILPSIDGISIKEYACNIGNIIGPKAIRYISRISNERICIYLDKKETVTSLTSKHKVITINDKEIEIRPMIQPAERIILSNVSPTIPNLDIENIFNRNNVRLRSKITTLKAGISEPEYAHILSFRRQVYIDPEDVKKIPDSFVVSTEEGSYRIFATTNKLSCFLCKREGYIAKKCTASTQAYVNTEELSPIETSTTNIETQIIETANSSINEETRTITDPIETTEIPTPKTGLKRPISELSVSQSSESQLSPTNPEDSIFIAPKETGNTKKKITLQKKKKRPITPAVLTNKLEDMLIPAKDEIENPNKKHILNYSQFKSFLENTFSALNPAEIAKEYTKDTTALVEMLEIIYPLLRERSIKNRIHRLRKKLLVQTSDEDSPWTTDIDTDIDII